MAQLVKNPPAMRETWARKIPWRRERLPTPVFWPGEFHGLYSPLGRKELDTTERLSLSLFYPAHFLSLISSTLLPQVPLLQGSFFKILTFSRNRCPFICSLYCAYVLSCFSHVQLFGTLWTVAGHMDCSPPGSSVHGILQARTLEWVAISFSNA